MVTKRHFTFETTNFIEQNGINGKKCHVSSIVSVLEAAFKLTPTLGDRFRGIRRARGSKVTLVQTGLTEEVNHNGTPGPRTSDNFAFKVSQLRLIAAAPSDAETSSNHRKQACYFRDID